MVALIEGLWIPTEQPADVSGMAAELGVVLRVRGFCFCDPLFQVDHFMRHDLRQALKVPNVAAADADDVLVGSDIPGVVPFPVSVACHPESQVGGCWQSPFAERRERPQTFVRRCQPFGCQREGHLRSSRTRSVSLSILLSKCRCRSSTFSNRLISASRRSPRSLSARAT